MHLVDHRRVPSQPIREPLGELEAQIESMGPDVEEQVARRRHGGVLGPLELGKGVKARRAGLAEETVPEPRAQTDHAAELALGYAKADRAPQPAGVLQQAANGVLAPGIDGQDQEDRRLCQRAENGLRLGGVHLTRTLRNLNIVVARVVKPSSSGYAEIVQRLSDALE